MFKVRRKLERHVIKLEADMLCTSGGGVKYMNVTECIRIATL
jgi:hypothetical protein